MDLLSSLASFMPSVGSPDDVFMALGEYRFSMSTAAYESFKRETKWRWVKQERLTRAPAQQYIGPGEDVITLEGVIYPHYRGGLTQIDKIRSQANTEKPLLLVDGQGYVYGYWVVSALSETHSNLWEKGIPLKQTFSLTLDFFGEDEKLELPAYERETMAALAGEDTGLMGKIASSVDAMKTQFNETAGPFVEQAAQALTNVGSAVNEAVTVINAAQSQIATVMAAKQSVDTLFKTVSNVTGSLEKITQGNIIANISKLGGNLGALQVAAGRTAKTMGSVNDMMPKTVAAIDNTLVNIQNAAFSAKSSLSKLINNG